MPLNLTPAPTYGSGTPFGKVPGNLGLPDPYGDLSSVIPKLGSLDKTASNDILSNLEAKLSPATTNALQNASATFGVSSGMPGSGLSWNQLYGNIAGSSTAEQALGLQQLNPFISNTSGTQTVSPSLQTQIAGTNASNEASPNPGASASYAANMFQQYLQQLKNPAGGNNYGGNPALDPLTGIPNWTGGTESSGGGSSDPYTVSAYPTGSFSNLGQMPTSY